MNGVRVRCPAKINWLLRVLARRSDGFHEIDTIFQAIDLWDEIDLGPADELTLECDDPELPTNADNLVVRAAGRLRERFGVSSAGARMRLRKRIPSGAGLGGGSSDAAGALIGLDRLWGLGLERRSLAEIGSEIGSDVAFFLTGGTARGTGRGERVEAMPFAGPVPLLVGKPPFGISTSDVYERLRERLTLPVKDVSLRRLSAHKVPGGNDFGALVNDLESVVYEGWPELSTFRDALLGRGAIRALLSGSGSSVFGVFDSPEAVDEAREGLRADHAAWTLIATRAVRESVHLADGQ